MARESSDILYLSRKDVEQASQNIDAVAIMHDVFKMHGLGQVILPEEAYLNWVNDQGETVRSLNMPGYIGGLLHTSGTKIINGNIRNSEHGLPRASGVTMIYDDTSVRITCIMEGAYLSSLRTAAVTALTVDLLQGSPIECMAIIGAGALARAHVNLLVERLPHLQQIRVFDVNPQNIMKLQHDTSVLLQKYDVKLQKVATAEEAIRPAQLIVPVTTVTTGYIRFEWLSPGALLVNVSLDDPLPEVVLKATKVIVDDWNLVKSDQKRLLGRMYREGWLLGPDECDETLATSRRCIDMQISDLVIRSKVGRHSLDDIILVNPFGLSIEDIALATHIYQNARAQHIGVWLER